MPWKLDPLRKGRDYERSPSKTAAQALRAESEAVYKLAYLLSRDGSFYGLDQLNRRTETKPLNQWNPETEAGYILLKDQFLAGDFDCSEGIEKARKLESQCPYPCHIFQSGGEPGRAHIFIQTDTLRQREYWANQIKALGRRKDKDCRNQAAWSPSQTQGITVLELAEMGDRGRSKALYNWRTTAKAEKTSQS